MRAGIKRNALSLPETACVWSQHEKHYCSFLFFFFLCLGLDSNASMTKKKRVSEIRVVHQNNKAEKNVAIAKEQKSVNKEKNT
jgi:hypothetical protein